MFQVKDIHSSKKIFSTNTNCKVSKPKIFLFTKMYTPKIETEKKAENSPLFLSKKSMRFVVQKNEDNKKNIQENENTNEGRWTKEEHDKFLDGIVQYGINWKKVKTFINSRTSVQVRSHAQKFYKKLKMCKDEQLGIDFTKDDISSIKDMIYQIKEKKGNYSIKYILNYLSDKFDHIKKAKKFNFQDYANNFLENKETLNLNNNLIINQNNEANKLNIIPQFLNNNQINNNGFPFNNNISSNNNININNTNFFDHQNALTNLLLMNNINNECLINPYYNNYNNNAIAINNILSNLNNPFFVSMVDKLISLLNLNNSNLTNDNLAKESNHNDNLTNSNFNIMNLESCNNSSDMNLNNLNRNFNEILCNNILNHGNLINNHCIRNENDDKNKLSQQNYNMYDNNININNLFYNNSINNSISDLNNNVNNSIYSNLNDNVNNKNKKENYFINDNLKN